MVIEGRSRSRDVGFMDFWELFHGFKIFENESNDP